MVLNYDYKPEQNLSNENDSQDTRHQERPTAFSSRSHSRDCQSLISTASHGTSRQTHSLSRKSTSSRCTPRPALVHLATSFARPPSTYNKARPVMSIRTSSATSTRSPAKDPLTFHHNSCRLFQSPAAIIPYHPQSSGASSTERLKSIDNPSLRYASVSGRHSIAPTSNGLNSSAADAASTEPTPPTIIDWTSSSTRRREYEKIDKSHRGLRGWWRRVAPRWCPRPRSSRTGFYDGGSDAGSVRRYRIELFDEDDARDDDKYDDMEKTPSTVKVTKTENGVSRAPAWRQNSWSCFNFRNR